MMTINPIRQPKMASKRLLVAVTAAICFAGLFAALLIVLVLWHSPLPIVQADSVASADRKLEQAEHADTPNARFVKLNEDEVNSVLHDRLDKSGRLVTSGVEGLHDLRVRLNKDRIEVFIVLGHRGAEITVDIEGKLYSQEGHVQFDPASGRIGALRLPQGALIGAMQQALSDPEQRSKLQLPPNISDLRVENSHILLRYN